MRVQVSDILKQIGSSKEFVYEGWFELAEADLAENIEVDLKLTNAGSRIIVTGTIYAPMLLTCVRCLEAYSEDIEIQVHEEFLPVNSPELKEEVMDWDSLSLFSYTSEEIIELYEVIRQNILASLPSRAVCSEVCPGIKLEEEPEEEEETHRDVDPRLLPLLEIKKRGETRGETKNEE